MAAAGGSDAANGGPRPADGYVSSAIARGDIALIGVGSNGGGLGEWAGQPPRPFAQPSAARARRIDKERRATDNERMVIAGLATGGFSFVSAFVV